MIIQKKFNSSFQEMTYQNLLLSVVAVKAIVMVLIILYGGIGLSPDEAQYWTWSRALDWGYYSKPPGIAWQIWLGTQFFDHTELGVRIGSVVFSALQAVTVYLLARKCQFKEKAAFYCGMAMALCPIGLLGSLLAITDNGFLLFWTLACLIMAGSLNLKRSPNPFLLGLVIMCGAIFKWPIYLFWIFFFVFRRYFFSDQKLYKGILGVLLSLIGLLPAVIWSWEHDWATFRHVATIVKGGNVHQVKSNFFEFLGTQALLLSPLLFGLLIFAYVKWIKGRSKLSPPLLFCGVSSFYSLMFVLSISLFQKIQGNWAVFIYPTAIVFLVWFVFEERKIGWFKGGVWLSLGLTAVLFALPHFSLDHTIYKINPFKHNLGWVELREVLNNNGYDPNKNFLVSDKYQTTSILSFYSEGQKRAYFLNLQGSRKNQFSYWPQLHEEQKEKTGYFVWVENAPHFQTQWKNKFEFYKTELNKYFENVEFLNIGSLLYHEGEIVKGAFIFKCGNCKNLQPEELNLY